jgi:ABC-2 type transport system permease protein
MKNMLPTLIKREFWEHRSLWIAPLAVASFLVLMALGAAVFADVHFNMGARGWGGQNGMWPRNVSMMQMGVFGFTMQLFFVSSITCGFYLLDCLYSERKDRSILFWKSLPVSDLQTVTSKFAVATVVVPLGVFLLAAVLYPTLYAISAIGIPDFSAMTGGWNTADWLRAEGAVLSAVVATGLWYAPIAAWSMMASVFSRRSPIMIALLPLVVIGVAEGLVFRSGETWKFLAYRLKPVPDLAQAVARPGLWIGLAVAAGMLYIVVRLRRYRDDT